MHAIYRQTDVKCTDMLPIGHDNRTLACYVHFFIFSALAEILSDRIQSFLIVDIFTWRLQFLSLKFTIFLGNRLLKFQIGVTLYSNKPKI